MGSSLSYNLILHEVRDFLGLTTNEYCVADSIYHLSNNPVGIVSGWCTASKTELGKCAGVTEQSIHSMLKKLISLGLVQKDEKTKFLKTTQKWYENVVLRKISLFSHTKETLATKENRGDKGLEDSRNFSHTKETSHNNNIYTLHNTSNNINISNNTNSNISIDIKTNILETWNSLNISKHRTFTDKAESKLKSLLQDFSLDEILQGIRNYGEIVKSPKTYFKHKWTLEEFLQREGGCRVFIFKKVEDYLKYDKNAPSGAIQAEEGKYDHIDSKLSW